MSKQKRKGTATLAPGPEVRTTRRQMVKSLASGGLILGVSGVPLAMLAQSKPTAPARQPNPSPVAQPAPPMGPNLCGSPQAARRFFNAILDPKVREGVEKNPEQALAQYGIQVPSGFLSRNAKLPSPENVRQILSVMDSHPKVLQMQVDAYYAFFAFFAFVL